MKTIVFAAALMLLGPTGAPAEERAASTAGPTLTEIGGVWSSTLRHEGETTSFSLEIEPGTDGKVLLKLTAPAIHLTGQPLGRVDATLEGDLVKLGPSGSPGSNRRPRSATASCTSGRPMRRESLPSTGRRADASGRSMSTAGPGASRLSPAIASTSGRRASPATLERTGAVSSVWIERPGARSGGSKRKPGRLALMVSPARPQRAGASST
jgi:hypothetical protein